MIRLLRWSLSTGLLVVGLIAGLLGWNVWTYHRLTAELPVAEMHFARIGDGLYLATLTPTEGAPRRFRLAGDDWQLDARLITWQPWMQLLGSDPLYRLDRLSGRYRDVAQARTAARSVHELADNPGLDLWALARDSGAWVPGVDAAYGTAVFLPMADDARYRVTLSPKGLVARPDNSDAKAAISNWN